jgi:hypothetical protein
MRLSLSDGRQFHVERALQGAARAVDGGGRGGQRRDAARPAGAGADRGGADAGVANRDASGRLSGLHYLKTGDPQIEALVQKVQRVLNRDIPLLILGETGHRQGAARARGAPGFEPRAGRPSSPSTARRFPSR